MFSTIRLSIVAGIIAILSGFYLYNEYKNQTIEKLRQENQSLELENQSYSDAIQFLEKDRQNLQKQLMSINRQFNDIKLQNQEQQDRIERNKKVLQQDAPAAQKIINESFNYSSRCFELLSGSPLTKKERDAKNAQEFNPECPWLFSNN